MNKEVFRSEKGQSSDTITVVFLVFIAAMALSSYELQSIAPNTHNRSTQIEIKFNQPEMNQQVNPEHTPSFAPTAVSLEELKPFLQTQ